MGVTCEGSYCGALGWIHGRHTGPWLGEEATNVDVRIRFGFHYRVDLVAGVVREGYAIFDLPDAFNQMGIDLYGRCSEPWAIKKKKKKKKKKLIYFFLLIPLL